MDLHACRVALATAVVLDGWQPYEADPGVVEYPALVVLNPSRIQFSQDYDGGHFVTVALELRVANTDELVASRQLDDAISMLADELARVDGPWETLVLVEAGRYRPGEDANTRTLAVTLTVTVTL